jgi:hypothetical protein
MRKVDRDALVRALAMVRTLDPIIVQAVDAMLKTSWQQAGEYASYHSQMRSLRLRPWQRPPCDANDEIDPTEGDRYGNMPGEVGLRRRMITLGLSEFEPNPLEAIERSEAEAAKSEGATVTDSDLREPSPAEPVV